jgi:DnaJ-class molecular chaperone
MEGVQAGGNPNGMGGFEDIFSFFGGGGGRRRDTGPRKGKPKLIEINITLE